MRPPIAGAGVVLKSATSALTQSTTTDRDGGFRFQAVSMAEAQDELRKFAKLLSTLPDRLHDIENFDLNIEALRDANVAGIAVSAIDAGTWYVSSTADASTPD